MDLRIDDLQVGRIDQELPRLRRRTSAFTRKALVSDFKVGVTNNPNRRKNEYGKDYDEMVVLYKTSSADSVRKAERQLVDFSKEHCRNINDGGGGPIALAAPPYYLYIVRKFSGI